MDIIAEVDSTPNISNYEDELLEYGIGYDCPLLDRHYDFMKIVAGGSLSAAKLLTEGFCDVVINWFGGWHHAQRYLLLSFKYK